jgi:hypothetical protein
MFLLISWYCVILIKRCTSGCFIITFFVLVVVCDIISISVSVRIKYPWLLCQDHSPNAERNNV